MTSTTEQAVPLLDLVAQYRPLKAEIMEAIERVADSQGFVLGPEVRAFEEEIARYCGAGHAIGVSSGTDALLVAMMALGIGAGDEVITTPYTFFSTAGCVHRLGARVVFVDIDPETFNIDPAGIERAITDRTRAIMPVHLYGRCADMEPILDVARSRAIPVIEDAAQSLGAEASGVRAGAIGDVACFSFYPAKNLGAFGDSGMVTVREDERLAETIRILRNHGSRERYFHPLVGGNFRLDEIQAAVLRVKLRHLDAWSDARRANAEAYTRLFTEAGLAGDAVQLPAAPPDRHIWNQYVIRARRRDELVEHLRSNAIGCAIYYPLPLHLQECFAYLGYPEGAFPHSERAARETLAIPVYPELTATQRERVVEVIGKFYNG